MPPLDSHGNYITDHTSLYTQMMIAGADQAIPSYVQPDILAANVFTILEIFEEHDAEILQARLAGRADERPLFFNMESYPHIKRKQMRHVCWNIDTVSRLEWSCRAPGCCICVE